MVRARPALIHPTPTLATSVSWTRTEDTDAVLRLRGGEAAAKLYSVTFKRRVSLAKGEVLHVLGDCEALGDMNSEAAVAMSNDPASADEGADLWSVTIKGVPMGARYSYLTADPAGLGEARPLLNYKLQVSVCFTPTP